MAYKIALTGHRPDGLPVRDAYNLNQNYYKRMYHWLRNKLINEIKNHGHIEAYSGLALGCDTVWAFAILSVKEDYPNQITFVAAIPDYNQSSRWRSDVDKRRWSSFIRSADKIIDTSKIYPNVSYGQLLQLRNLQMIDPADELIAIYNGSTHRSGTGNAVQSAKNKSKNITIVHPNTFVSKDEY